MNMNKIENYYEKKGTLESDLFKNLSEISDMTEIKVIKPYCLAIYSIATTIKGGVRVIEFSPDDMEYQFIMTDEYAKEHIEDIPYQDFYKIGFTKNLIEEVLETGFFLKYRDEDGSETVYVPSPNFSSALASVCGAGKLPKDIDPMREMYLAYLLRDIDSFSIVLRKDGNIAKAIAAFSAKHEVIRQDNCISDIYNSLKKQHDFVNVSYYNINHFKTSVQFNLPDMKIMKRGSNDKRYTILPCFMLNLTDCGNMACSLQPALSINGKVTMVSDAILPDSQELSTRISEEICNLSVILSDIDNYSEAIVNKKDNVRRLMKKLKLSNIGIKYEKIYNSYMETFSEKCPKFEVLLEILSFPSKLTYLYTKEYKQLPPEYIIEKVGKLAGNVFTIDFEKECF